MAPCLPSTSGRCSDFLPSTNALSLLPNRIALRGSHAKPLRVCASASSRRDMSLQQRWRAFKFAMNERKAQLVASPPISAIVSTVNAVKAWLQPLVDLFEALMQRWEAINEAYNQFLAEETKAKWTWAKRNRKELELLAAFPPYIFGKYCLTDVDNVRFGI
jgi:hypothetical protein